MIDLIRTHDKKGICEICGEKINQSEAHVILEFKIIPLFLAFFHVDHYKEFCDTLKNFANSKNGYIFEQFLKLNTN